MMFGSLFAGIGGIDLGLERAGMQCRWQVEIDDYCNRVLAKHWPDVPRYRDVRDVGTHNLAPVDLIAGGFPCQDVSLAGQRAGLGGQRSTLWSEFARVIRELRPRWVLAENVPGLLSSDDGRFFGQVLRDLAESGYDAEWDCIPACAVGAPHRRDRVWIVAYAECVWQLQPQGRLSDIRRRVSYGGEALANTPNDRVGWRRKQQASSATEGDVSDSARQLPHGSGSARKRRPELADGGWWAAEPEVGRVAHGVPHRVDRLRGLGNAVVPQVVEMIGRAIMEVHA